MHGLASNLNFPNVITYKSPITLKQQQISSIKPQLKTLLKSLNKYIERISISTMTASKKDAKNVNPAQNAHIQTVYRQLP